MTKAATLTLGLSLLLSATAVSHAQAPAQETAVNEAVVRQAQRIQLRQKLDEADDAQQRRDLVSAAKLYDKAWELVQSIGYANVEPEAAQARAGLAIARLELARGAQRHGDYRNAAVEINDVLRVDPGNAVALEFKAANDKLLEANKYKMPDADTQARVPDIIKEKGDAATKVQDGKLLFEMGKMSEAKKVLLEAVKQDPHNQAAYYYLNLINESKFQESLNKRDVDSRTRIVDIEDAWYTPANRDLLPIPNMYARTNLINTSPSRQVIYNKLNLIHLDNVTYDGLPLTEVIKVLDEEAKKRDPERRGINFLINANIDSSGGGGGGRSRRHRSEYRAARSPRRLRPRRWT